MVEAEETHYKLGRSPTGQMAAQKVKCARVYHFNVVLKIKTRNLPGSDEDVRDTSKVMHMEKARLVVNKLGILRLQSLGDTLTGISQLHSKLRLRALLSL